MVARAASRVSYRVGRAGINLVDLTLIPLVHHEITYREVGAVIERHVQSLTGVIQHASEAPKNQREAPRSIW